jgi:hypothetical protein
MMLRMVSFLLSLPRYGSLGTQSKLANVFQKHGGMLTLADTHWSQLNILFASAGALCSYENQGGSRNGDSLPYLWR